MPVPAPPSCTRYQSNGARCRNTTARTDRWCGLCDGFAQAQQQPAPAVRRDVRRVLRPAPHGLEPDEAYDIAVSRNAIATYYRWHRTDDRASEAQIRSLLEDAITTGAPSSVDEAGRWIIRLPEGYGLVLSPGRDVVVAYFTSHRERTWQQVRAGVRSRTPSAKDRRTQELREAVIQRLPIRVTPQTFNLYARRVLDVRASRKTFDAVGRALDQHLSEHVLPRWTRGAEESVDDGTGWTWLLVRNEQAPAGLVIGCCATQSLTDQCRPADDQPPARPHS